MKSIILIFCFCLATTAIYAQKNEPITAPNKGLQLKDINSIILKAKTTGTAYGATLKATPYLLLNDGTIYSRPKVSPHDLDVFTSKKENPSRWGKWSKTSNGLNIQFKNPQNWKNYYKTRPAKKNELISGTYKCVGSFDLSNTEFNTIIFKKDGTFTLRYFYRNDKKFIPHKKDSQLKGSYKLNNYTIEMSFSNDIKKRFLIALFEKGGGMLIGSKSFAEFEIPSQYK